jgi:hypothetical protein
MSTRCSGQRIDATRMKARRHPTRSAMSIAQPMRIASREKAKKRGPPKNEIAAVIMAPSVTAENAARASDHTFSVRSGS